MSYKNKVIRFEPEHEFHNTFHCLQETEDKLIGHYAENSTESRFFPKTYFTKIEIIDKLCTCETEPPDGIKVELKFDPELKHEHETGQRPGGKMTWEESKKKVIDEVDEKDYVFFNSEPYIKPIAEWTEEQKIKWLKNFGAKHWYCGIETEDRLSTVIRILQDYEEDYAKLKMFLKDLFPKFMAKTEGHTLSSITINVFDNLREIVDHTNLTKIIELASVDLRGFDGMLAKTQEEEALIQKYRTFLEELK